VTKDIRTFDLPVNSDLGGYALVQAMEIIDKEREEQGRENKFSSFYTLAVASQGMSQAALVIASFGMHIYLSINFEYDADEWCLALVNFSPHKEIHVHSNGA